jgi:aromatic ring-cleaving dioxygenase
MVDDKHTHVYVWKEDFEKLKDIQNSTGEETLLQTFHNLVSPEKKALTLVNFRESDYNKLKKIQDECGFRDLGSVIHHVIEMQASLEMVTSAKIMKDCTPMVLSGKPLSGKTYWTKNVFIPSLVNNPVLVIDANGEYESLKEIKSIRELDLANNHHVRFCPAQHSVMGTLQVKQLFTELNMSLDMNKDALKNLVLIVEEAQGYKSSWFNGFLYKSRHYIRKMIVVSPQTDCFQGLQTFTIFQCTSN